jgi:hypothetical protein
MTEPRILNDDTKLSGELQVPTGLCQGGRFTAFAVTWTIDSSFGVITPCWFLLLGRPRRWNQQGVPKRRKITTTRRVINEKIESIKTLGCAYSLSPRRGKRNRSFRHDTKPQLSSTQLSQYIKPLRLLTASGMRNYAHPATLACIFDWPINTHTRTSRNFRINNSNL